VCCSYSPKKVLLTVTKILWSFEYMASMGVKTSLCDVTNSAKSCLKNQSSPVKEGIYLTHHELCHLNTTKSTCNITYSEHHTHQSKWVQNAKHLHITINTCYILTNSMIEISSTLNNTKIRATEFKRFIEISRTLNTAKIRATESKRLNYTSYVYRVAKTHRMP